MNENEIAQKVVGVAIEIHKKIGPGLLESAYQECLHYSLKKSGLYCEREKPVPLVYEELFVANAYRADFIVENRVILEIKSVDALNDIHLSQTLTYLRLTNCKLGLLINFNTNYLKNGLRRVVNGL